MKWFQSLRRRSQLHRLRSSPRAREPLRRCRGARIQCRSGGVEWRGFEESLTMQKHVLMLTASTFILACGVIAASAQQVPDVPMIQQQPKILQQRQELERQLRDAQTPRRGIEDDLEDNGGMKGWRYGPDWRHHESWRRGAMGPGMTDEGGRMLFSLMDSDGDGTISLQETHHHPGISISGT